MTNWDQRWVDQETPWDKGEATPALREALAHPDDGEFLRKSRVLVPGCGSGHDVRGLAEMGARVVGLDLSPTAVEVARGYPPVADEDYQSGSLFDWRDDPFDAVWEHTCFCAIHPSTRDQYAEAIGRLVRPGGRLIGVFYLDPEDPDDDPPYPSEKEEIVRHLEPWFTLVRGSVPKQAFPSREGREWLATFVRHERERRVAVDPTEG